jgi:hypothetical protein
MGGFQECFNTHHKRDRVVDAGLTALPHRYQRRLALVDTYGARPWYYFTGRPPNCGQVSVAVERVRHGAVEETK